MGNKRSAQSVAEYSILVAVVIMALAGMSVYAQRGLQGRFRDAVKATESAVGNTQYEPDVVMKVMNQTSADNTQRNVTGETVHNVIDSQSNVDYSERLGLER